ncbi:MFS transporter [Natronospira bacteriovora]|uniref:MFS transporter n=1 Tax=Natronospira bacteriovora TaxID=3069753 RepID=A0ABU0W3I8_9GAMM|nr:MFS transporter [Natronospira sp. AB-CW4]MDQ2068353.1 MFS transporter [Natronospira sp. AB-CW4]
MTGEAQTQGSGAGRAGGQVLLAIMALAVFVSVLNNSMINVAIPRIREDLGVSASAIGWLITAYALVFAVGTALYGRVSDFVSLRKTFLVALLVFAAGSLLCALAPGFAWLVAGRVLQAAGAAAIPALALGSVTRLFPPGARGQAFGAVISSVGVGAATGPIVGGLVVSVGGWPWLFLGTLLLLIMLAAAAWLRMPDSDPADRSAGGLRHFGLSGGLLISVSAAALFLGVTGLQQTGPNAPQTWGPLLLSLVTAAGFATHIRYSATPFAPPALFRNRTYLCACGVAVFAQAAFLGGGLFLIPLLMIEQHGLTPLGTGLVLAPSALAIFLLSRLAGHLSDRIGPRAVLQGSLGLVLAGLLFLSTQAQSPPGIIAFGLLLMGVGFTGVMSPNANAASFALSREIAGIGSGIYQLFFFMGAGLGAAAVGAFLSFRSETANVALNPLYSAGPGAAPYSDTFLLAAASTLIALVFTLGIRTGPGHQSRS